MINFLSEPAYDFDEESKCYKHYPTIKQIVHKSVKYEFKESAEFIFCVRYGNEPTRIIFSVSREYETNAKNYFSFGVHSDITRGENTKLTKGFKALINIKEIAND